MRTIDKKTKYIYGAMSVIFFIYSLSLLYPFLYAFLSSVRDPWDFLNDRVAFPETFDLSNYVKAFTEFNVYGVNFIEMFINSVLYTLFGTLMAITSSTLTSYVIAKYKFRIRGFLYGLAIFIMIVPIVGSQAAEIKLAQELHLYNSMIGMWIMRANFLGLYFLVFYAVFKSMPKGYYEASRIDGANDMQVMLKVALPLVKFTFFSIFLILFIEYWNDYLIPNLYLPNYKTLSLALFHQAQSQELENTKISRVPYVMASVLCVTVPVIIIFAIFSKRLMGNMSVGGLKG